MPDMASAEEVQSLVDYAVSEFGGLHVMYNNAGVSSVMTRLLDDDLKDFHRVMSTNLLGTMLTLLAKVPPAECDQGPRSPQAN